MTNEEISREQRRQLMLLKNIDNGKITLKDAIISLEAEMEEKDVAYVEKKALEINQKRD